ncbi:MAG: murein biosynthesis integral membrane protein MurJ [Actinobacteria bacterium]|nr:MAG: murein biosynthesis integral membrane protein MurJ [Actinomycetota bacterium]
MTTPEDAPELVKPALDARSHGRRLARSTAVFSLATGLSRVLGLVREMVSAYYFGVTGLINAFTVAFQIPNLVRALLADAALSGAFVPVFNEMLERGEKQRAWRVASTLFWLMLLGLGAITAIFILLAPLLLRPFGNPGGDFDLAVGLARVLFPIVVLLGLSGIVVGILNTYEHFAAPALAPVAWNLVIILGLVLRVPRIESEGAELYLYAGVVVAGTLVQLLLPVPWLRRLDGRLTVALDWRDPAVRRVFALMLPVTLTIGLINVNLVVDTLFASRLLDPELAPASINAAFRLYMLPQGMFAVAVAAVLFPTLSRLVARGDEPGFGRALDAGIRQIAFLLVPAGLVSIVLAEPIVRLVYQRGEFTAADTTVVAQCLQAFSDELDPYIGRARQPRAERGPGRGLLQLRHLGDSARDVGGEPGRDRNPARADAAPGRLRRLPLDGYCGSADRGCGSRLGRLGARRLVRARRVARTRAGCADRVARRGVGGRRTRVPWSSQSAPSSGAGRAATVASPARRRRTRALRP